MSSTLSAPSVPGDRAPNPADTRGAVMTIGALFFIFGFVTWLNGPLITFVKLAFDLNDVNAFLVPMAFYLSYFFLALPASAVLRRTGMKKGMGLGLLIMAGGALLFGQYTAVRHYPGALFGLFVIGAGLSLLQTASNPYISILGPIDSAAQRIAFLGICNKFAGFLAPLAFGAVVLQGLDHFAESVRTAATPVIRESLLTGFAAQVRGPYFIMAGLLVLLAIWIARSRLPDLRPEAVNSSQATVTQASSLFDFPHLWLGALCLFLYMGVEVMAGDAIGIYGSGFQLPLSVTRFFTSATLFAMVVGYLVGLLLIPRFVSQQRYLAISAILGIVFTLGAYLTRNYVSIGFVAALGFANAMMWPAIFPLAIKGAGRHTETGSALLIMGIAGGAVVPYLYAALKQYYPFQLAYMVLCMPCYLYILYYGVRGYARPCRTT